MSLLTIPLAVRTGEYQDQGHFTKDLTVKEHIIGRFGHGIVGILNTGAHAIDTVGAAAGGALALVSVGTCKTVNVFAFRRLNYWSNILPDVFKSLTLVINPKAQFPSYSFRNDNQRSERNFSAWANNLYSKGVANDKAGGFVNTLVARVQFIGSILAFPVARVADTVLGIFAGLRALAWGGTDEVYNETAYRMLNITRLPLDLTKSIVHLLNPWATLPVDPDYGITPAPANSSTDPLLQTHTV